MLKKNLILILDKKSELSTAKPVQSFNFTTLDVFIIDTVEYKQYRIKG